MIQNIINDIKRLEKVGFDKKEAGIILLIRRIDELNLILKDKK